MDANVDKNVVVVVGTRPEAIKMAPVVRALRSSRLRPLLVSTGQHRELLTQVFGSLELVPDRDLDVMRPGQRLAALTGRLLEGLDGLLEELAPSIVLAQGDTTTVLATALTCFYQGIPFAHVEAGLRTGDRRAPFPEEGNRVLTTRLADLHFAPTEGARRNLEREGVPSRDIVVTGNTVVDALQFEARRQDAGPEGERVVRVLDDRLGAGWTEHRVVLVTGHRRENFGSRVANISRALTTLATRFATTLFVVPVHLNPQVSGPLSAAVHGHPNVRLIEPLGYGEFIALLRRCDFVLTDSGGVQEEAPCFGKPVLILRDATERPEGCDAGVARLVGTEVDGIVRQVSELLSNDSAYRSMAVAVHPYGDGAAARRIVEALERRLGISR